MSYMFKEAEYNHTQTVFKQGDTANFLYIVVEGEFEGKREIKLHKEGKYDNK